ncbi:hypothetical protein LO772_25625 [Yinghuangia sp. ASG 101]|uniref:peptidase MA family metallohydrolase n=1 Tax=Yinghuangia sp. ASG 101 TaxID=2896848 RepID=UPI001E3F1BCA|nr:hypothetical protein [Yinghuangia sp. ASG 101]UGQ10233.1 hypothetical protein LO772_25625 [Yinghuangia sp. ASG 101]
MDHNAARPTVDGPHGTADDHRPGHDSRLIPRQIPTPDAAPPPGGTAVADTTAHDTSRAPLPGTYQWVPVPGPRTPSPRGPVAFRHPGDALGLWPESVVDPRRDRHTAAIIVCSLLAALTVLIAGATSLHDRAREARAAVDAGLAPTPPPVPGTAAPDTGTDPDGDGTIPHGATEPPALEGEDASSTSRASVLTRVQKLAGTRSAALAKNDATAFLGTVDKNNKALLDTERRLFANLRKVPFAESTWSATDVADARTEPSAVDGWPINATVLVAFRHQLANVDVRPVAERYQWTIRCVSAADVCGITNVAGGRDSTVLGPSGYPAPWDVWDLAVERRPHVVVFGPAATAADLRTRADQAETAAVYDIGAWKGPGGVAPGFAVTLTRERATFETLYSSEPPGEWAAGFALPLAAADDRRSVGGSRVVIDLDEMDQDAAFARVILRHELVHALLDPLMTANFGDIPLWAAEGFADWVAQADRSIKGTYEARAVGGQIDDGTFTGELPTDDDFAASDEDTIDAAYNQAHLALRYLADTYGADKACAFIADVYRGTSGDAAAAIRTATGKSLDDFEKDWAAWTRRNFG